MPTIHKTTDYSVFKRIPGNRSVSKTHVKTLREAIDRDNECITYNPILVNEKLEVIDGQHRLEAISQLELPVYYIQKDGLTLENVQSLNSRTRQWTPTDYAKSYAELGIVPYEIYLAFKKEYGFNHDILRIFLTLGEGGTMETFKQGNLKVTDKDKSHHLCKCLKEVGELYNEKKYKLRGFAFAFKKLWEHPNYDHGRMVNKMQAKGRSIEDYSQTSDYVRALEKIFNHGLIEEKKIIIHF